MFCWFFSYPVLYYSLFFLHSPGYKNLCLFILYVFVTFYLIYNTRFCVVICWIFLFLFTFALLLHLLMCEFLKGFIILKSSRSWLLEYLSFHFSVILRNYVTSSLSLYLSLSVPLSVSFSLSSNYTPLYFFAYIKVSQFSFGVVIQNILQYFFFSFFRIIYSLMLITVCLLVRFSLYSLFSSFHLLVKCQSYAILCVFPLWFPFSSHFIVNYRQRPGRPGFNSRSSHTKDSKMVLDISLLNTQHYKVRIKDKVNQSKQRSRALPYNSVS